MIDVVSTKRWTQLALATLLTVLLGDFCCADTLIENVGVFDGERVLGNQYVLIQADKIASIGAQSPAVAADTLRVDGAGKTLIPGLIDCHTHAFFSLHLQQSAIFGVTTVLDMMSIPRVAAVYRQQQIDGKANDRADYFSAGAAVTVKDGHGTQMGFPVPTLATAQEAQAFIDARIAEGSDYIKIIYDHFETIGVTRPTLSKEMLRAAIEAAHARDKMAVCHIGTQAEARNAIEFGADGLVHLFADSVIEESLVQLAKKQGVFIIPTAAINESLKAPAELSQQLIDDPHLGPLLNRMDRVQLKRRFPGHERFKMNFAFMQQSIGSLAAAGVPILAGTDAPNAGTAFGASLHHEMQLLVRSGLSPAQALAAATSLPAQHFGLSDRGRIAAELRADLCLVRGDPTQDIKCTRDIVQVWKAGNVIDREERRAEVVEQNQSKSTSGT